MSTSKKAVKLMIFLMRLMGLWHSSSRLEKIFTNIMLILVTVLMFYSVYVQSQQLYYSRNSLTLITLAAPAVTVALTETSKLIVFITKRTKVTKLNKLVDDDFWKRSYTGIEKQIFDDCDILCFNSICLCLFFVLGTCCHYVIYPLTGMLIDSSSKREFPFPMRYQTFLYESPYYEINFILQLLGTLAVGLCFTTFASYSFVVSLFTSAQFEIFNVNLKSLCDFEECRKEANDLTLQREALQKLRKYIVRHQMLIDLTNDIEDIYCYIMLGQIFGAVAQTCFCGMQILWVKTDIQRAFLGIEFLFSNFCQFLFYCYSSHAVFEASGNTSQAVCFNNWYKITDPQIRREFMQLIMIVSMRAQRPCILTVGKFYPLTLATFTSVIGTSISYFMVLRQLINISSE